MTEDASIRNILTQCWKEMKKYLYILEMELRFLTEWQDLKNISKLPAFIQVPEGVSFGENKTAYIVIGIAGVNDEHLDILAKLAITCSDIENVEKLRTAQDKQTVMKILSDV